MVAIPILLGFLPSIAWLSFYLHEDFRHPEPRMLVALTFVLGGIATFLVLPVELWFHTIFSQFNIDSLGLPAFLASAAVEELFKFGMVYFFVRKTAPFNYEPIHPMVYMTTVALGFAAMENIGTLFRASDGSLLNSIVLETMVLRFIGATLLHSLASGTIGYYWGKSMALEKPARPFLVFGVTLAVVLHGVFNYLIIKTGPVSLTIPLLIAAAFFVLNDFELLKKYERTS